MTRRGSRILRCACFVLIALVAACSPDPIYDVSKPQPSSHGLIMRGRTGDATPRGITSSPLRSEDVVDSDPHGPLFESCEDAPDGKWCKKWDDYEACRRSGFENRGCDSYVGLDGERRSFIADCRQADVVVLGGNTCDEAAVSVAVEYVNCRLAGRRTLYCETLAVYRACTYRGGGDLICADVSPVYEACRARYLEGKRIPLNICIEGSSKYEMCRNGWGVTVNGDVCLAATAVYENCRVRSAISECEARLVDYAKENFG